MEREGKDMTWEDDRSYDYDVRYRRLLRLVATMNEENKAAEEARIKEEALMKTLREEGFSYENGVLKGFYRWKTSPGLHIRNFNGHRKKVCNCAVSSCGKFVFSSSFDRTLKVWDVKTGACLATYVGHTCGVSCLSLYEPPKGIVEAMRLKLVKHHSPPLRGCYNGAAVCMVHASCFYA